MRFACCAMLGSLLAVPAAAQLVTPLVAVENHMNLLLGLADPHTVADTTTVESTIIDGVEMADPDTEIMPTHPNQHDAAFILVTELAISRSRVDSFNCKATGAESVSCDLRLVSLDGRCTATETRQFVVRDGKIVRITHRHNTGDICNG